MDSPFGKKLFRFFLLFALIPSLLLALVGYYISTDSALRQPEQNSGTDTTLNDYYTDRLFDLIRRADSTGARGLLDFQIVTPADYPDSVWQHVMPPEDAHRLAEAMRNRTQGFVEIDGRIYQYVARRLDDSTISVGAVIHDTAYAALTAQETQRRADLFSRGLLRERYALFLALVFAALGLIAVVLAYYFSTRLARNLATPISDLGRAAGAIAAGDFKQHVEPRGGGEITELIEHFNHMADKLETTTARLTQAERVAAWRHVARRFAHELKNPLQPISISLYRIQKALADSPDLERVAQPLEAVAQELTHLTELAERFSSLAKLPPPALGRTDLTALMQSVADLYRERLAVYSFALTIPQQPVFAMIDETYFREALHNLLQNAIDASPKGTTITLRLTSDQQGSAIEVSDEGAGMSAEVLQTARMPYFTTKGKGSGLGLAVVEKTVSEINGRLDIVSAPGKGTTVTIHLPPAEQS